MSEENRDVNVDFDETPTAETVQTEVEDTSAMPLAETEEKEETVLTEDIGVDFDDEDDEDDDEAFGKKKKAKKRRKPLTPEQKKKRTIKALIITGAVLLVLAIFFSGVAIANTVGVKALIKSAKSFDKVEYTQHEQLKPVLEEDGYWTFVADDNRDFKVLQFTDVHIGGGSFSQTKDAWAMNAVATMIRAEQPDLVIITGDIAYPVPFQAGTFNNLAATQIFANMMESLEVYWTFAFGNHDTEAYSMYERKDICEYYENAGFEYCLFDRGYASEELGYGNDIVKVKNSDGVITQALVTIDSHSYIDGDYFGMAWKYDNIHQSQVDWYVKEMQKFVEANNALADAKPELNIVKDAPVKNLAFFHIPLVEYREAWKEIFEANDGRKNDLTVRETEHVKLIYGIMGESDGQKNGQRTYGVFSGIHEDEFFEQGVLNGLQGTFCGHDHYNNFSVEYTKEVAGEMRTVRLTYGMSVDYLAYPGIYKEHLQRGCTVIEVKADGSFNTKPMNYYDDYGAKHEKG